MKTIKSLYQSFLKFCTPCRCVSAWSGLPVEPNCFNCPELGTMVLAQLCEEFLEADLVAAGIATRLSDGLVMNSAIIGPNARVVALQSEPAEPPYALLTSAGVLSTQINKPLAILEDYRTRELLLDTAHELPVVFSVDDLIVMRRLGLPATLFGDLSANTPKNIMQLADRCRWGAETPPTSSAAEDHPENATSAAEAESIADDGGASQESASSSSPEAASSPTACHAVSSCTPTSKRSDCSARPSAPPLQGDTPRASKSPLLEAGSAARTGQPVSEQNRSKCKRQPTVTLFIAGWSVSCLTPEKPSEFQPFADRFLEAARYLELDDSYVGVWSPTADLVQQMRFCLDAECHSKAIQVLQRSIDTCRYRLHAGYRTPSDESSKRFGLSKALHEYEQAARGERSGRNGAAIEKARRRIVDAIDLGIYEPLLEAAQTKDDVPAKNLGYMMAHVARLFHRTALLDSDGSRSNSDLELALKASAQKTAQIVKLGNILLACHREAAK